MTDPSTATPWRLNHETARSLFERNFGLLNEHDVRHVPTIFAEDVVFQDDAWPQTIEGHRDMEGFLTSLWRAIPDFRFELIEGPYLGEDGHRAAVRVRVGGTASGSFDPPGYAPTGTPVTTEFGGFYEFEGDRVKRARIIVNMNDVGIQVGAAPAPGTRSERLVVRLQHVKARRMRKLARP